LTCVLDRIEIGHAAIVSAKDIRLEELSG